MVVGWEIYVYQWSCSIRLGRTMRRIELVFCLHDGSINSLFMIVVTVSSHTVSCSQGGSAHLAVGVIAITSLCTAASSITQEPVAHRRMSKGTCLTLFIILTVILQVGITSTGRTYWRGE